MEAQQRRRDRNPELRSRVRHLFDGERLISKSLGLARKTATEMPGFAEKLPVLPCSASTAAAPIEVKSSTALGGRLHELLGIGVGCRRGSAKGEVWFYRNAMEPAAIGSLSSGANAPHHKKGEEE